MAELKKKVERDDVSRSSADATSGVWFVVVTNHGKEGLVIPQLLNRGMNVYRPMAHKTVTHARQTRIKALPLYASHLFVQKDECNGHAFISGMIGVAWIYPRLVLDACIERHRQVEVDGFIEIAKSLDRDHKKVGRGSVVRTLDGLLDVVVTEEIDDARVSALSGFMNGNSRLVVDISRLAK